MGGNTRNRQLSPRVRVWRAGPISRLSGGPSQRLAQVRVLMPLGAIAHAVLNNEVDSKATNSTKNAIEIKLNEPTMARPMAAVAASRGYSRSTSRNHSSISSANSSMHNATTRNMIAWWRCYWSGPKNPAA
jgi:hypothetical protein